MDEEIVEVLKFSLVWRESIILDNLVFDLLNINILFKFMFDEMLDNFELV